QQPQSQQSILELRQIYQPEEYASNAKKRKLSAMNRELYNLIGSNVPPLAIDTASVANASSGKKFKGKLVNNKVNAPWKRLGFKNSARDDDLILYHWTKANPEIKNAANNSIVIEKSIPEDKPTDEISTSENGKEEGIKVQDELEKMDVDKPVESDIKEKELDLNEYRYVKYNTKLQIPTFTEEEYEEAMKVEKEKRKKEAEIKEAKEKVKLEKEAAAEAAKRKKTKTPDLSVSDQDLKKDDSTTSSKSNTNTPMEKTAEELNIEETNNESNDSKTSTPAIVEDNADADIKN
ncbi:hypothetical protein C6P40_004910, partial [Pichia californica]